LTGRHRNSILQRIGIYPSEIPPLSDSPRIWFHAVSMGEVNAAVPIIGAIRRMAPRSTIILSTTTEHGQALARNRMPSDVVCIYAPIDFFLSVRAALRRFRPDLLVCLETELWPNWLMIAHRMGIKTAVVNGRISENSCRRYKKIRPLIRETLKSMNAFSMIHERDAQRIREIGAPSERIWVNGNAKYDLTIEPAGSRIQTEMRKLFGISGNEPVFLAGSTRHSEEAIILDAYRQILRHAPGTRLILAPRHIERTRLIEEMILSRGLSCQRRTRLGRNGDNRTAPVVILDTMGELQAVYSIATVVFCGGSLAPLGGQNILEPASWAKPVLYGPYMEDFLDARHLLESTGGGSEVKDENDLAEKALFLITRRDQAEKIGNAARLAVEMNQGAAQKHADVIFRLLQN
jgi:3-deoxy-D-manno-octulosonic-acid transferase